MQCSQIHRTTWSLDIIKPLFYYFRERINGQAEIKIYGKKIVLFIGTNERF